MTREEIKAQYTVDDSGVIRTLGKFEAEPVYAPYFWDSGMNGMSDEDENGVWFFVLSPEDKAEFPDLRTITVLQSRNQIRASCILRYSVRKTDIKRALPV